MTARDNRQKSERGAEAPLSETSPVALVSDLQLASSQVFPSFPASSLYFYRSALSRACSKPVFFFDVADAFASPGVYPLEVLLPSDASAVVRPSCFRIPVCGGALSTTSSASLPVFPSHRFPFTDPGWWLFRRGMVRLRKREAQVNQWGQVCCFINIRPASRIYRAFC